MFTVLKCSPRQHRALSFFLLRQEYLLDAEVVE